MDTNEGGPAPRSSVAQSLFTWGKVHKEGGLATKAGVAHHLRFVTARQ